MTYSDVVMWMWVLALLGTLVVLARAWRGLARVDAAVGDLRSEGAAVDALAPARAELDAATRTAAGERMRLGTRAADG